MVNDWNFSFIFVAVDYLFMNPLFKDVQLSMAVRTFSRHWKKRQALEVGHRGMGNSYTKCVFYQVFSNFFICIFWAYSCLLSAFCK